MQLGNKPCTYGTITHASPVGACSTALIGRSLTSTVNLDDNRELLMSTSTRGMSSKKPVACMHM